MRNALPLAAFIALALAPPRVRSSDRLAVAEVEVIAGVRAAAVPVEAVASAPLQGFSFGVRSSSIWARLAGASLEGTITEAVGAEYFSARPVAGGQALLVGCLLDTRPPFEDQRIPALRDPLPLAVLQVDLDPDVPAGEAATLELVDGLGRPPIACVFVEGNRSRRVEDRQAGAIAIVPPPRGKPLFLRCDANQDGAIDVADPIFLLDYGFRTGPAPPCLDAADANDSGDVDLADAIFLLDYLFGSGRHPWPPVVVPGPDPTPDPIRCEAPYYGWEGTP